MTVKEFGLTTSVKTESEVEVSTGDHYVPAVITIAAFALNLEVSADFHHLLKF